MVITLPSIIEISSQGSWQLRHIILYQGFCTLWNHSASRCFLSLPSASFFISGDHTFSFSGNFFFRMGNYVACFVVILSWSTIMHKKFRTGQGFLIFFVPLLPSNFLKSHDPFLWVKCFNLHFNIYYQKVNIVFPFRPIYLSSPGAKKRKFTKSFQLNINN